MATGKVHQILPRSVHGSFVVDEVFLSRVLASGRNEATDVDLCFGRSDCVFNCIVFNTGIEWHSIRSLVVFARTVIFQDSCFDCGVMKFFIENEFEVRSGKFRFSSMNIVAKWLNIDSNVSIVGKELMIRVLRLANISANLEIDNQIFCRAKEICVGGEVSVEDLYLFPTYKLKINCKKITGERIFFGGYNEEKNEVMKGSAQMKVDSNVKCERMNICTCDNVEISGEISIKMFNCSTSRHLKIRNCRLASESIRAEANSILLDKSSVLEGSEIVLFSSNKVAIENFSSFQCFAKFLVIDSRKIVCPSEDGSNEIDLPRFRNGDVFLNIQESLELFGTLKCKNIFVRQTSSDFLLKKGSILDVNSLIIENKNESKEVTGMIMFENESSVVFSKFMSIETKREISIKGSLKKQLYHSPNFLVKTSKSIEFVESIVDVGETQLYFGEKLILNDNSNLSISGNLFLLEYSQETSARLEICESSALVVKNDIICQFRECFLEGVFESVNGSIYLGQNNNTNVDHEGFNLKNGVRIKEMLETILINLKPSSRPLQSLFHNFQKWRIKLVDALQRIIRLKKGPGQKKSYVMNNIVLSGRVLAKKTVLLVSKDISLQNQCSIECTSSSEHTAILMYSNRSVFQCWCELDASSVCIVSPVVFQLASLIKSHNLSVSSLVLIRMGCLCNATKSIVKVPLIVSGLNIIAPNVNKTLQRIKVDLIETCTDAWMSIEKLAEARLENREFDEFILESIKFFKKHSPLILLHSLEFVHFVLQVVNLVVPKTALLITVNAVSIIRASMFLLFSVKNIFKSIKRYLTSERHNFILVEIVGDSIFSAFQTVNVSTSIMSIFDQIRNISDQFSSRKLSIQEYVSGGALPALSSLIQAFDTFVLNDYTKYAIGLFSYMPSNMSFGLMNLSADLKIGMYVVNNSVLCSVSGSVVVLTHNTSSTDLLSFGTESNIAICSSIYEKSTIGKVDRGVKIASQLLLMGGSRVHEGGFHFGENVVLKSKNFDQHNNSLTYNRIGGLVVKGEWNLIDSSSFSPLPSSKSGPSSTDAPFLDPFGGDELAKSVGRNVQRSGNRIEYLSVGNASVFYLKNVAIRINNIMGEISVKNVQVEVPSHPGISSLNVVGGMNTFLCESDISISFPIHVNDEGTVNIISSTTTIVNGKTDGIGKIAFFNAEIGEDANVRHKGSVFFELKNENDLSAAIEGNGNYSKISCIGQVSFKINGDFVHKSNGGITFESFVRKNQDIGVFANSISIDEDIQRKQGVHFISTEGDIVIRKSIISEEGSVIIQAKNGNVLIEDHVEEGSIVTKCQLDWDGRAAISPNAFRIIKKESVVKSVEKIEIKSEKDSVIVTSKQGSVHFDPCIIHGFSNVYVEGKTGVVFKNICTTNVEHKKSSITFFGKRSRTIKTVAETSFISSSTGDISINSSEGNIFTSGISVTSNEGLIYQNGRDGIDNESVVTSYTIFEKKIILGGVIARETRNEKHQNERPSQFHSEKGIFVESEKGTIKNVGTIFTGNEIASFKAQNILFQRRVLIHELEVKKRGLNFSFFLLGCDVFNSTSKIFENLKKEILDYYLPPIGSNPIEVARSLKNGNVPETAANLINALLPGNMRFKLQIPKPVELGLTFNECEISKQLYSSLGEGQIEVDRLFINAENTLEFDNAYGFIAGNIEIQAVKLIEKGAFLNYHVEDFSRGIGVNFDPMGSSIVFLGIPSIIAEVIDEKELSSIGVVQIGNAAHMKIYVEEWIKNGSQTFAETIEGRVGNLSFDSTSSSSVRKTHSFSVGTSILGLSDFHSKASLLTDQSGLFVVNCDDFQVESVHLRSSRCPVRGIRETNCVDEVTEFEKLHGTSLGVDFGMAVGGKTDLTKIKKLGIERKDYVANVKNSIEKVSEEEFHYRVIDAKQMKAEEIETINELKSRLVFLFGGNNKFQVIPDDFNHGNHSQGEEESEVNSANSTSFLCPKKEVLKDKNYHLRFHYDHEYYLQTERYRMKKELVDEGVMPCLGDFDGNPQALDDILKIFYDSSFSDLDKYSQLLFYGDLAKNTFENLTDDDQANVLFYQWFIKEGGNFWDIASYSAFREDMLKETNNYDYNEELKCFINRNYPWLRLHTENDNSIKRVSIESNESVKQQMNLFFAEQMYPDVIWEDLTFAQKNQVFKIGEYALMYHQTDQDVEFNEFVNLKESDLHEYIQRNSLDTTSAGVLTTFGILSKENGELNKSMWGNEFENEYEYVQHDKKYPAPGSELFFLLPIEKGGWEGFREFFSTAKDCIWDYFTHRSSNKSNYEPTEQELYFDKSLRSFFSGVIDFIPPVNMVKWGFQGIFGKDPITKERLPWDKRITDVTFSMFLFPQTANIIIGYGKASWETMKGGWKIGKNLVLDGNLKNVFETIKMTGAAAVESVAKPTDHLARTIHWSLNRSAPSFKYAGEWCRNKSEWFSNKMSDLHRAFGGWRNGRHWNVGNVFSIGGRRFAHAGGTMVVRRSFVFDMGSHGRRGQYFARSAGGNKGKSTKMEKGVQTSTKRVNKSPTDGNQKVNSRNGSLVNQGRLAKTFENMKMFPFLNECYGCFLTGAIEKGKEYFPHDQKKRDELVQHTLKMLKRESKNMSPVPDSVSCLWDRLNEIHGGDPFKEIKKNTNDAMMVIKPSLDVVLKSSRDPLYTCLYLSSIGNLIDFASPNVKISDVKKSVERSIHAALDEQFVSNVDYEVFVQKMATAKNVLFLADNCGEVVLDMFLIEYLIKQYPKLDKVVVAVRGERILNDVTMEEAKYVGLHKIPKVEVMKSCEKGYPGTVLSECREEFLEVYQKADLIIAKGQGNFETLCFAENENLFMVLKAKCVCIQRFFGVKFGKSIMTRPFEYPNSVQKIATTLGSDLSSTFVPASSTGLMLVAPKILKSDLCAYYEKRGKPMDVVRISEKELVVPEYLTSDDVIVDLLAAPIHPADLNKIEGRYGMLPDPNPRLGVTVGGNEGVGRVEWIGKNVLNIKRGDLVIPILQLGGTWATRNVFNQNDLFVIPPEMPIPLAAIIRLNPVAAWRMLNDFKKLSPGDRIIQNGADSAVGKSVIQLCNMFGVETINIIRDLPGVEHVKSHLETLGATQVVTLEELRGMNLSDNPPLLALNCIGGDYAKNMCKKLGTGGICVTYGNMSHKQFTIGAGQFIFQKLQLTGFWLEGSSMDLKIDGLENILKVVQERNYEWNVDVEWFDLKDFRKGLKYYYSRDSSPGMTKKVLINLE